MSYYEDEPPTCRECELRAQARPTEDKHLAALESFLERFTAFDLYSIAYIDLDGNLCGEIKSAFKQLHREMRCYAKGIK